MLSSLTLAPNERRILDAVATWNGADLPTATLLAKQLGYANESAVRWNYRRLEAAGWLRLEKLGGKIVVPRLTDEARAELGLLRGQAPTEVAVEMPTSFFDTDSRRVLRGRPISCGVLEVADAEADGDVVTLRDPRDFFPTWDSARDVLLLGHGESMHDPANPHDSIFDGDYIQSRAMAARNGDIVHAEYERGDGTRECTLKVFALDEARGQVTLTPLNPAFETIVLPGDCVHIRGVVVMWLSLRSWRRRK